MARNKDLWIIEYTNIDDSRSKTIAYHNRDEAVAAAIDFIERAAKDEIERFGLKGDDALELNTILGDIAAGRASDAIIGWLGYQGDVDPDEMIAIGPSGSVSDSPYDFR